MRLAEVGLFLSLVVGATPSSLSRPGHETIGHRSGQTLEDSPGTLAGDVIQLTEDFSIKLFPFPHLTRSRGSRASRVSQLDTSRRHVPAHQPHDKRRVGFFSDNPLISVKRSFQDIQTNVERSMQTLLAAGSEFGQRMLGMITRSPRLLLPSSPSSSSAAAPAAPIVAPAGPAAAPSHQVTHGENFPDFSDCDCHFGSDSVSPSQFQPYNEVSNDIESYGAPAAEVVSYPAPAPAAESYGAPAAEVVSYPAPAPAPAAESYGAPAAPVQDTYGSPQAPVAPSYVPAAPAASYETPSTAAPSYSDTAPVDGPIVDLTDDVFDNTIDGEPIIAEEPVIHPGGSQSVDYNKVSHVGVHSVVQAASAQVPDQSHPEKYLNHNHDWVVNVVEHNLWRKETKKFKHHHHGEKLRVIPHLHQASI